MPKTARQDHELLTVQEAADFLNVSPGTIRRWAYQAQLNGRKIGPRGDWRFTKKDLEAIAVPNSAAAHAQNKILSQESGSNAPHDHRVQFYDNDTHLISSVRSSIE